MGSNPSPALGEPEEIWEIKSKLHRAVLEDCVLWAPSGDKEMAPLLTALEARPWGSQMAVCGLENR